MPVGSHSYHITYFNMPVSLKRRLVTQNISRTMAISKPTPMAVIILMSNILQAPGQSGAGWDCGSLPPARRSLRVLPGRKKEAPPQSLLPVKHGRSPREAEGPAAQPRGGRGFIRGWKGTEMQAEGRKQDRRREGLSLPPAGGNVQPVVSSQQAAREHVV